ncbi:hypothetical protein RAS12_00505 [Achromobacter seleniivolatilans]|uniref:Uncharacterized protein n=1 Tax=Achromobacter seleniivolatilans TaxID=3047478 RepID=A0ABY9M2T7_9BURK|nr:hypothetical protein [Achromobacter sp. R39]WMD20884.1 hypothetical protein RAS12_00505 [Achromobacter sp. R39]
MKKGYQVALLLAFGALFAAFAFNPPKTSGDWASWVQAWGSIAAICAAIWIAYDQHAKVREQQASARHDEVRNFLFGIREELHINWVVYMQTVGDAVQAVKDNAAVDVTWPVPENPFKVYASTVGLIGRVPDDLIRKQIVATYVVAGGLMLTWKMHNTMRAARDAEAELVEEMDGTRPNGTWVVLQRDLTRYSQQLRKHQNEAEAMIGIAVDLIDTYLKKNPASSV